LKRERILGKLLIYIMVSISVLLLVSIFPFSTGKMAAPVGMPLSDHWTLFNPTQNSKSSLNLPSVIKDIPHNTDVTISRPLPETAYQDPALYFVTEQQKVKVFIDQELIYEYNPILKWFSQSPGRDVHLISLPHDSAGSTLTIAFNSPYRSFSGILAQVWMGSRNDLVMSIVRNDLIPLALAYSLVIFGIILLALQKRMAKLKLRNAGTFYLGLFSVISGIWIVAESNLILLFIKDPVFLSHLALVSLYCLPVPLLLFVRRVYHPARSRYIFYLACGFFVFFVAGTVLQVLSLTDYILLLPCFHLWATFTIVSMVIMGIQEIRSGNKDIRFFFYGCLLFGGFIMVDVILYYAAETPRMNTQSFFRWGLLLFILFSSTIMGQNILHMRDIRTKNRVLHSLAYTDTLTRLKNRASFEKAIRALQPVLDSQDSVTVVVVDINNLKTVNDTLGHAEGDRLLVEGARIMRTSLSRLGEIYRIGGDEFAIIIRNTPVSIINDAIAELFDKIDHFNSQSNGFKISMAYGMDSYQKGKDKDLNSVIVRADKAMYRCKKNQKLIQVVGTDSE